MRFHPYSVHLNILSKYRECAMIRISQVLRASAWNLFIHSAASLRSMPYKQQNGLKGVYAVASRVIFAFFANQMQNSVALESWRQTHLIVWSNNHCWNLFYRSGSVTTLYIMIQTTLYMSLQEQYRVNINLFICGVWYFVHICQDEHGAFLVRIIINSNASPLWHTSHGDCIWQIIVSCV